MYIYFPYQFITSISAKEDNTNVTVNNGTGTSMTTLTNSGDHLDVTVTHPGEQAITSTGPVMVDLFWK